MMKYMIFGESHGPAIGVTLEGVPPGIQLDMDFIDREMKRRSPGKSPLSTPRMEDDKVQILSGVFQGMTTGTPLCAVILNTDTRSTDYEGTKDLARPGHADYSGFLRYGGNQDYRGSGHFSGRITAPLVFAGALAKLILKGKGITVGAHIREIAGIADADIQDLTMDPEFLEGVAKKDFPVFDDTRGKAMQDAILKAKEEEDSVGGIIQCLAIGFPGGKGDPGQESVESVVSRHIFAVPAVKGIEFGTGFRLAAMRGSASNDQLYSDHEGVKTRTNHNGGINGGISNGMPINFSVVVKPTSSIGKTQQTINMRTKENTEITIKGRHDPCIVHRAVPVIEAAAALALCEILKV